jgi:hypothetical protein
MLKFGGDGVRLMSRADQHMSQRDHLQGRPPVQNGGDLRRQRDPMTSGDSHSLVGPPAGPSSKWLEFFVLQINMLRGRCGGYTAHYLHAVMNELRWKLISLRGRFGTQPKVASNRGMGRVSRAARLRSID